MIIVDFETTSLLDPVSQDPKDQPGIVQIGLIKAECIDMPNQPRRWAAMKEVELLVNPEKAVWDPIAMKVHGITQEQVASAPTLPTALSTVQHMFLGERTWCGANNPFDRRVLYWQLMRYGLSMHFPWPPHDVDVLASGRAISNFAGKRDNKPPSLAELHTYFTGAVHEKAHSGLADCQAVLVCLNGLEKEGVIFS